jgi:hypothetical protein
MKKLSIFRPTSSNRSISRNRNLGRWVKRTLCQVLIRSTLSVDYSLPKLFARVTVESLTGVLATTGISVEYQRLSTMSLFPKFQ